MSVSDEDHTGGAPRRKIGQLCCETPIHLPHPKIDRDAWNRIGRDLRRMYEALLLEPLPERILDLVARLGRTPRRTLQ